MHCAFCPPEPRLSLILRADPAFLEPCAVNSAFSSYPAAQASSSTNLAKATWPGAGGAGAPIWPQSPYCSGSHQTLKPLILQGDAAICLPFCSGRTSNAGHWPLTQPPSTKITGQQPRQPHVITDCLPAHEQGSGTDSSELCPLEAGQLPCSSLPAHNRRLERNQLGSAWTAGRGGDSWGPQSKQTL